jgi:hypothetical protein
MVHSSGFVASCDDHRPWLLLRAPLSGSGVDVADLAPWHARVSHYPSSFLKQKIMQMNRREQRRRRWGAPRAMLLAGAPLAARQTQRNLARLRAA